MAVRWIATLLGRRPDDAVALPLFDAAFYRATYPEAARHRDPFGHFMRHGWRRGHNPHPLFDTRWYLANNEDVRKARINPLRHFMESGWREGRDPHPLFDVPWYLASNPDVRLLGVNPVLHYLEQGAAQDREPHPDFRAAADAAGASPAEQRFAPFLAPGRAAVARPTAPPARSLAAFLDHIVRLAAQDDKDDPLRAEADEPNRISFVVPVYNTKRRYLDDLLASFRRQPPGFAELVLSDDGSTAAETLRWLARHAREPSVQVVLNGVNRGIAAATNAGIAKASGSWIALLDHDDALVPHAVSRIVRVLRRRPICQFLYTDELVTDKRLRPNGAFLKPAWDPVLLSGMNYINHLSLYRKDRLDAIGGVRQGFEGSQDHDLLLRYTANLPAEAVVHLPYPAYLWRRDGASFSARAEDQAIASARRALRAAFERSDRPVEIGPALGKSLHRVDFDPGRAVWPPVSVVIPSRDALPLITRLLEGLTQGTDYPALDIVVIDNGSTDPAVLALYERYRSGPVPFRAEIRAEPFNFSRAVNRGVAATHAPFVLLLNNDVEVIERGWLKEMVACFAYPDTGVVGARLLYPDRTLQHVGVITGLSGLAGHWWVGKPLDFPGPMGRLRVRQSMSAVTGAVMLVSRHCFERVGAFDETTFPIAYNDVDFCLRTIAAGLRVVFTPFATLIHHESASRGSDESGANAARFGRDKASLRDRHRTDTFGDRAFNPWMSRFRADCPAVLLERLPEER